MQKIVVKKAGKNMVSVQCGGKELGKIKKLQEKIGELQYTAKRNVPHEDLDAKHGFKVKCEELGFFLTQKQALQKIVEVSGF